MGIGPTALRLYETLSKEWKPGQTVLELGAQDFKPDTYDGPMPTMGGQFRWLTARKFYALFGMTYESIDLNGQQGAMKLDLNAVSDIGRQFDLVTNHGTTEHVFNQACAFRLIHNATRPGGMIVHVVPTQGYENHGLYSYTPRFFQELAGANNYTVQLLYKEDDVSGTLIVAVLCRGPDGPLVPPMQLEWD